ncbi:hypothetical protein AAHA92_33590 [Salvia divinorum]|uniref:Uncharacterized protein n=1 Tax=Salvia divinorum TaxID=28513 RepID=A0ABD1FPH1_SALDI
MMHKTLAPLNSIKF